MSNNKKKIDENEKSPLEKEKKQKIVKIPKTTEESETDEPINVTSLIDKKCFGLKYEIFGNVRCFYTPKQISPIIVIGPHWYIFILMNIIAIPSFIFFYNIFFSKVLCSFLKFILITLVIITMIQYIITFFIDPGIIISSDLTGKKCEKCQLTIDPKRNSFHCMFCNVCYEDLDHHCVWVGKCIGKKTKKVFYSLLGGVVLMYLIMISSVIYYFTKSKKKI